MSQTAEFTIRYDGPALDTHTMDIRELAPALLALSDAMEAINALVNSQQTKLYVKVKGGFKSGSFGVDLHLAQESALAILYFFGSPPIAGAATILQFLGVPLGSFGLIQLVLWVKNRRITNVIEMNETTTLFIGDETQIVAKNVFTLFCNVPVRKAMEAFIAKPLSQDGIDSVAFVMAQSTPTIISKQDASAFIAPLPQDQLLSDIETEAALQIISVSFQESNKWRFSDGASTFYAPILDTEFMARVQSNKTNFAKDDILMVVLRKRQFENTEGLKTEYEVLAVKEHRRLGQQLKLNYDTP